MKSVPSNLKLKYLYRDDGNYKIFGSIVLRNATGISPAEAANLLQEKLIDREYFYPSDAQIPLFEEHNICGNEFTGWYEFDEFSFTEEKPSNNRTLGKFLRDLK
ncbi:hypothetical protein [Autumnicola edwardsiae]|uniref:Uncharacterized protein n=1 Tax=Autumnicola edwardsiae TaxID=3075594 RepID=A0ABU3CW45_9FLAO|nr:hypothetical protein [Zunongwangia sp. F297]MDT0650585.1 hypothetical protein [Zunongwangia sp. F297]